MSPRLWKRRPKTVTVPVWRGGTLTMPEPAWCSQQHDQHPQHPSDFRHLGVEVPMHVNAGGRLFEILAATVVQEPFADGDILPAVSLDLGTEYGRFTRQELLEFADGLEEHAHYLRLLADEVEERRQAAAAETRPAGMPADWPWPPDRDTDQQ
ncbi:DUF6907 domain-containing protein [Streptacidiphilus melanogenes]|uniref:DUF6907 domain-containing protein n=1 Tax=Streptacidiphilus melanogenes TaxID=411235 RepID=UPI0005A9D7FC|nr:hypothetical protein [Streptacidiphilus melanogenes]